MGGVLAALLFAGAMVVGFLAYIGVFATYEPARVVRVGPGTICVERLSEPGRIDCTDDRGKGKRRIVVGPGDCVSVHYGEGVNLDQRIECPHHR